MKIFNVCLISASMVLASCGGAKKSEPEAQKQPQNSSEESLPAMTIVKVPVDKSGKELHDKAELRLVNSETKISKENVVDTFASAKAPAVSFDELDASTSSESCGWLGWGPRARQNYCGQSSSCSTCTTTVQTCSTSSCCQSGTNWQWTFYRPTYLQYGYSYGYNYSGAVPCTTVACGTQYSNQYSNQYNGGYSDYDQYNYYYYNRGARQQGYNPGSVYQSQY